MAISLARLDTGATLELGCDLDWRDRYTWSPVAEAAAYCLTGALLIEQATRQAGRPITLESPADDFGLLVRAQIAALYDWSAIAGLTLTLDYHGEIFTPVAFRFDDGSPIEARPIYQAGAPQVSDWMQLVVRLRAI